MRSQPNTPIPPVTILLFSLFILLMATLCYQGCKPFIKNGGGEIKPNNGKVSWNLLFDEASTEATRKATVRQVKQYVEAFCKAEGYILAKDTVYYCPCDPLLYNYDFQIINGSGGSVTTTPNAPKRVPGSGDGLETSPGINYVMNEPIKEFDKNQIKKDSPLYILNRGTDHSKVLAIIDAGFDPGMFSNATGLKIWKPAGSEQPIYNFLPEANLKNYMDDSKDKHGTAVTAVAYSAIGHDINIPLLLPLKALDSNNVGTVFSVSCALSYAVQKQASLINLSLGYYGEMDSILRYYIWRCDSARIPVIAAAGNMPGHHIPAKICQAPSNTNLLSKSRLFYPACFNIEFPLLTSVTQLKSENEPCMYQNYSPDFVTLGVFEKKYCCSAATGLVKTGYQYYEGTSFAAPVVSGLMMQAMIKTTNEAGRTALWNTMLQTATAPPGSTPVTVNGHYVTYAAPW